MSGPRRPATAGEFRSGVEGPNEGRQVIQTVPVCRVGDGGTNLLRQSLATDCDRHSLPFGNAIEVSVRGYKLRWIFQMRDR